MDETLKSVILLMSGHYKKLDSINSAIEYKKKTRKENPMKNKIIDKLSIMQIPHMPPKQP
jgi:hypothetical protein